MSLPATRLPRVQKGVEVGFCGATAASLQSSLPFLFGKRLAAVGCIGLLLLALLTIAPWASLTGAHAAGAVEDNQTGSVVAVSAASFDLGGVAPESIVAAFGVNLATRVEAARVTPLPTSLAGTTLRVRDSQGAERVAPLFFVAPNQINFQMPAETAPGEAEMMVTSGDGTVSRGRVQVIRVAPGLFTVTANGRGIPAAIALRAAPGGVQTTQSLSRFDTTLNRFLTNPVDLTSDTEQVYLVLFGTGIRRRTALTDVTVRLGGLDGVNLPVLYAGPQGSQVGLDQINVGPINRTEVRNRLTGRGTLSLAVIVTDSATNTQRVSNVTEIELAGLNRVAAPSLNEPPTTTFLAGQLVTLTGGPFVTGDISQNRVRIGGVPAFVTAATSTQLTVQVPYGATTGRVSVLTPNGEKTTTNTLQVGTSISGLIETSDRQPLAGVVVKLLGSTDQTTTRSDGSFILPVSQNPPMNVFLAAIQINPQGVSGFQNYGTITRRLEVTTRQDNRLLAPISLQRPTGPTGTLGTAINTAVPVFGCGAGTDVSNVIFRLETNATATVIENGAGVPQITLTQVQECRAPQRLPMGLYSSRLVQIAPVGTRFNPGGQLIFPNSDNLPVGTQFRLYRLDQQTDSGLGEFIDIGAATVSADRSSIETAARAITESGVYFVALPPQSVTTVIGRVVELGANNAEMPAPGVYVSVRGQAALTDGDGAFILRNVPVLAANDTLVLEAKAVRANQTSDSAQRLITGTTIKPGGVTVVSPDIVLNSLNTTGNNRTPVANTQTVTLDEDTTKVIVLSGADPDGNPLRYTFTQPANGTLTGTAPYLIYTPNRDYSGPDNFTFRVNDGKADSNNAVVAITVNPLNDPPVLRVPAAQSVKENETLSFTVSATDPDAGQVVRISAPSLPAGASFLDSEGRFVWTPSCTQAGVYTVTFLAIDNGTPTALSDTKSVQITVVDQNCAPTLSLPPAQTVNEGQLLKFTVTATDPDPGQQITLSATNVPTGAAFDAATGMFSWTPGCTQSGTYQVNFTATDNGTPSRSETRSTTIIVNNVSVPPTITVPGSTNDAFNISEGQQLTFTVRSAPGCSNQTISIAADNLPAGANLTTQTVSGNEVMRQFMWTPTFTQAGTYQVSFKASDATDSSAMTTRVITINVVDFNRDPEFNIPSLRTIPVGQQFSLVLTATDPDDGQIVTLSATDLPTGASFNPSAGNPATGTFIWTPSFNQIANFTVTFRATDNGNPARTVTRQLLLIVSGECDPILTVPAAQTVVEQSKLSFTVIGSPKCPGQQLTLSASNLPPRAMFDPATGIFMWTPNVGEVGNYTATFTVTDNNNPPRQVSRTVAITVVANRAPIANAQTITTEEDKPLNITLTGTDPENQALTYTIVQPPQHGTLTGVAPNLIYTPIANYNGADSFTFRVSDGTLTSATATVTLTVTPVNDAPTVSSQTLALSEDTPANIVLAGFDPDGDTLTYTITRQPTNGTLSGTAPNLVYTPNANYFGTDEIRYRANDASTASAEGIISITITQVNDAPTLTVPGPVTVLAGQAANFTVTGADVDAGQTLAFSISPQLGNATFTQTSPTSATFNWIPANSEAGTYTLNVKVTDNGSPVLSTTKQVTLVVNATTTVINITAPTEVTVAENQPVNFTVSASGGTVGQQFTISAANLPAGANFPTATSTNDTISQAFTWTPTFAQAGTYDIPITVTRGAGVTQTKVVRIIVTNVCRAPMLTVPASPVNGNEGQALTFAVTATDPDTGETLSLSATNLPTGATFATATSTTGSVTQNFNWTPAFNQSGTYVVNFSVTDNCSPTTQTASGSVTIVIGEMNRPPVANSFTGANKVNVNEDTPQAITLVGSDPDNDPITYSVVTAPAHGTLTGTGASLTYTPAANYTGADTFTYKVNDGRLDSALATVEIMVLSVCDAPVLTVPATQNVTLDVPADCNLPATATPLSFTVSATDADAGDTITLTAQNLPPGATFTQNGNTGTFTWTPSVYGESGSFVVTFRATDACAPAQTSTKTVTINFTIPNTTPRWQATNIPTAGTNVLLLQNGNNVFATQAGSGVYLTTNNGLNWPRVDQTGLTNNDVRALISKPNGDTGTYLFVGTTAGVFRSADNGVSWTQLNNGLTTTFVQALAVASDGTLFAGTSGGGVFYSTNDGGTWTPINNGISGQSITALLVAGSGANTRVFAGTQNGQVFSATLAGLFAPLPESWTSVSNGLQTVRINALESNADGTVIYAGTNGAGVARLNLGAGSTTWESVNLGLFSLNVNDLARISGTIYAATQQGVARFDSATNNWTLINECLPSVTFTSLAPNSTGTKLYAGTEDGRVLIRTL